MNEAIALPRPWTFTQKLLFRFGLIFFILFILFNPNGAVPLVQGFYRYYTYPVRTLVVWGAPYLLHKPLSITTDSGSSDTVYNYLILLFLTVFSAMAAVVWSVLNRSAAHYNKLYYWLLVILRFYVAIMLINYGAVKIMKIQFPFPPLGRLLQRYGDSSPMGLAWTFMGYSRGYNYFAGFAELLCGLLLFFRRTTLIGAAIGFAVVINVVAINYCFDVPVKIISTMLLLMVMVILLKDVKRLSKLFLLNEPVEADNVLPQRFREKWKNTVLTGIKYLLIVYVLVATGNGTFQFNRVYGSNKPQPILSGIFNTQTFVFNKDTITTNATRWNSIIIGNGGIDIRLMNDSTLRYTTVTDTVKKTMDIGGNHQYKFNYNLSKDSVLTLNGTDLNGTNIRITLKRFDEQQFPLVRRGFHWINEKPYKQ